MNPESTRAESVFQFGISNYISLQYAGKWEENFHQLITPSSAEFVAGVGCEELIVLRRLQISDCNALL